MNLKSKKGYSLVEIGVGILILTVFLICSIALFNGCYNTYRMIQQRNIAINLAVSNMESLLQTDADILTGFFTAELNSSTNEYELLPNSNFKSFVEDNFEEDIKLSYAKLNGIDVENVVSADYTDYIDEYIYEEKESLINKYILNEVRNYTEDELANEDIISGNYGMLVSNVKESGNEALLNPGSDAPTSMIGEMGIRKTITRLPITDGYAFGNKVLKIKVEVLYTNKINTKNITDEDIKTITLESIKIAN